MYLDLLSLHTQEVTITIIHTGQLRHRAVKSLAPRLQPGQGRAQLPT